MPARTVAITLILTLATAVTVAASCPPANGRDAAACDAANPTRITTAVCAADAHATETCADHATGTIHAIDLTRAASEWRKAAIATGHRTPRARQWLAHAMVLDERVQDDPGAPIALRQLAKHDEQLAKAALLGH